MIGGSHRRGIWTRQHGKIDTQGSYHVGMSVEFLPRMKSRYGRTFFLLSLFISHPNPTGNLCVYVDVCVRARVRGCTTVRTSNPVTSREETKIHDRRQQGGHDMRWSIQKHAWPDHAHACSDEPVSDANRVACPALSDRRTGTASHTYIESI